MQVLAGSNLIWKLNSLVGSRCPDSTRQREMRALAVTPSAKFNVPIFERLSSTIKPLTAFKHALESTPRCRSTGKTFASVP